MNGKINIALTNQKSKTNQKINLYPIFPTITKTVMKHKNRIK